MFRYVLIILFCIVGGLLHGCTSNSTSRSGDPDERGLTLPNGFEVVVVVDSVGPLRHLSVDDNGDIYAKLKKSYDGGSLVALRDTTGDGKSDIIRRFGDFDQDEGSFETGSEIHNGYLYVSTNWAVYRYDLSSGDLVPQAAPDTIMVSEHDHGTYGHMAKPLAFDNRGHLYVPFGAPSNACQKPERTPGVSGQDPCPDLKKHGGIRRFDADETGQTQEDGYKFASGIRSVVAMDWNPEDENLYVVQHGRDNLHRLWPNKFSRWENAMLPAEEFIRVTDGSNFGWPYCYYDQLKEEKVLAPEYGGDGETIGKCDQYDDPILGFPGHFAPNDLLFYQGKQFPDHYDGGAFVAFHGSTIRDPYPQAGYFVGFVPFENGAPSGEWEVFANGFSGIDPIVNTGDAEHRPSGLAVGPDGSMYITEDNDGKIWRITYTGDKDDFGPSHLARMEKIKRAASNVRTPDKEDDVLQQEALSAGGELYNTYCASCHQGDGKGAPPRYPPLAGTEWVTGDKQRLISIILNGLEKPIEVKGESYSNAMPQHSFLSNEEVAAVATYIRQNFGNNASAVGAEDVGAVRELSSGDHDQPTP